jgi:predicted phage terminase large subunit-like protein
MLGRLREGTGAHWGGVSSPAGKNWFYDIIVNEGLDPWSKEDKVDGNNHLTTIVQRTGENPFLPAEYEADLRKTYTSLYASQELDGNIVTLGGHIIQSSWFYVVPYTKPIQGVRHWDFAVSTEDAADYSAGALLSFNKDRLRLSDMKRYKLSYPDLRRKIIETARADGESIILSFEKAGQQLAMIDDMRRDPNLRRHVIRAERPQGDKLGRALPWISQAEFRNFEICQGNWNREFCEECDAFTGKADGRDDQIDAVSGSFNVLTHLNKVYASRQAY